MKNKKIFLSSSVLVIIIVVIAIFASLHYWQKQGITQNKSEIIIGQHCDAHNGFGFTTDQLNNSKGLQCYPYGPTHGSEGNYTRYAIWISPIEPKKLNFFDNSNFDNSSYNSAVDYMIKNWTEYNDINGNFSFKYPSSQWEVQKIDSNLVSITGNPDDDGASMMLQFFPQVNFWQTDEYKSITDEFSGLGSNSLNDNLQYWQEFNLDGKLADAIFQLPKVAGDQEQIIVYITGTNGYLKVSYARNNQYLPANFLMEALIKTINIK
jgi:hypothetical protein